MQVDSILARLAMDAGRRHRKDAVGGIQGHVRGRVQIQDVSCNAGTGRIIFYLLTVSKVLNFVDFWGWGLVTRSKIIRECVKNSSTALFLLIGDFFAQKCRCLLSFQFKDERHK